jgi:hypothetical protein
MIHVPLSLRTLGRRSPSIVLAVGALLPLVACSSNMDDPGTEPEEVTGALSDAIDATPSGRGTGVITPAAVETGTATYHGGPVISNVRVTAVYWSSEVAFQSSLSSFYASVTNSTYFDWLTEYHTNTQGIGRGSLVAAVVDPSPPSGTTVQDTQITGELQRLIQAGAIPTPGPNDLYMVHFPPGYTVLHSGFHSCPSTGTEFSFCGFHNTFAFNNTSVPYGVVTDVEACGTLCGPGDGLGNTTSTASHELLEAVTDLQLDAWFASDGEEIADLCQGVQAQVSGFTVQRAWSDLQQACVVKNPCLACSGGSSCHCGDFICRSNTSQCP